MTDRRKIIGGGILLFIGIAVILGFFLVQRQQVVQNQAGDFDSTWCASQGGSVISSGQSCPSGQQQVDISAGGAGDVSGDGGSAGSGVCCIPQGNQQTDLVTGPVTVPPSAVPTEPQTEDLPENPPSPTTTSDETIPVDPPPSSNSCPLYGNLNVRISCPTCQ